MSTTAEEVANGKRSMQETVNQVSHEFKIEVISDPHSPRIEEVAALDARLFGEHKSLPPEAFREILESGGAVLGHINESGALISEASIILNAVEDGECSLERELPQWLAYCDGAAVDTEYRGRGLQKQLLAAREAVAIEAGKEASSASVRQKNVASVRSMLAKGYILISDAPQYYGSAPEDDRVAMLHDFELGNPFNDLDTDHKMLERSIQGIIQPQDVLDRVAQKADVVSLPTEQSDEVDDVYNKAVSALLSNGYIGVACGDIDVGDGDAVATHAMTFLRVAALPPELANKVLNRKHELDLIVSESS